MMMMMMGLVTELHIVTMCSGSVVVTAYDFESGRPGSNPEWGANIL